MPLRRCAAVLLALVTSVALAGCSGGEADSGPAADPAIVTPTALGDRPLVEVVGSGAGQTRALALDLAADATNDATIVISQEVVRDEQAARVPPITVPFTVAVTGVDGDNVSTAQTYAEPTIDATGLRPADVRRVRQALGALAGTTSTLVVRPDGTVVKAESGVAAAAQVDAQVRALVPVLPSTQVGVGASWTATSVAEVDGATVDQMATYTLESLEGEDYVIGVSIDQTYRPGEVEGVEVKSGRGTITARLDGNLGRLLPDSATGNASTQVSYVVGGQVTEVRTTVTLGLTTD